MSVDERLRRALREQAESFMPPVETALDRVHARGRRARWLAAATATVASAAAVVAIGGALVLLGTGEEDAPPVERPTGSPSPSATDTPQSPLRGSITADVARPAELAGRWTIRLNGNGTMEVSPPPGFAGDLTGSLFTADSTSFRTTLFEAASCAGDATGIYDWLRVGDRIEFHVVTDTCDPRSRFFEDSAWSVSTDSGARG